ncbi:hypothetical protein [Desulfopila sp. IMCC35008]|uniref:hypothetical protein n=1 Tax=Desulfopila sp. IMCC35008 TaxID=2653858 RepID=UPI0013D5461E|nr:hypothetical protein [Desulfopila sp. IMCC35008]
MHLNRIQIQIFEKLSSELNLEMEDYLFRFSKENISRTIKKLDDLTEKEADTWITKAYLKSLG